MEARLYGSDTPHCVKRVNERDIDGIKLGSVRNECAIRGVDMNDVVHSRISLSAARVTRSHGGEFHAREIPRRYDQRSFRDVGRAKQSHSELPRRALRLTGYGSHAYPEEVVSAVGGSVGLSGESCCHALIISE